MRKAIFIALIVGGATTALAVDTPGPDFAALQATDPSGSVQYLYDECTATDLHKQMFCAGYISAMVEAMMVLGDRSSGAQAFGICPKAGISAGAGMQAFKNWVQKHPEGWGAMRYVGVSLALKETWPCT